jgi:hypothetical protein
VAEDWLHQHLIMRISSESSAFLLKRNDELGKAAVMKSQPGFLMMELGFARFQTSDRGRSGRQQIVLKSSSFEGGFP